jgi:hypothetical protein
MTGGFSIVPAGTHVFRIYEANYDEEFGKIEIKMVNADGMTHIERFRIKNQNDELIEGALSAFSYFAKNAMDDFGMTDVDPEELIDHYIRAEVIHNEVPSTTEPGRIKTFVKLGDKSPAVGFDKEPVARALTLGKETAVATAPVEEEPKKGLDLDALLG